MLILQCHYITTFSRFFFALGLRAKLRIPGILTLNLVIIHQKHLHYVLNINSSMFVVQ